MIDEKEVTAYVTMPDCFLQGCSEDIVIFRADGGNHFTDYGIYEGMFLFFDRKKRFKKGRLSCTGSKNYSSVAANSSDSASISPSTSAVPCFASITASAILETINFTARIASSLPGIT